MAGWSFRHTLDYHLHVLCTLQGIKNLSLREAARANHRGALCSLVVFDRLNPWLHVPHILIQMAFPEQKPEHRSLYYTVTETESNYLVCFTMYEE